VDSCKLGARHQVWMGARLGRELGARHRKLALYDLGVRHFIGGEGGARHPVWGRGAEG
jgi:hypothetical protein